MKQRNIKQEVKAYFLEHPTARLRIRQLEREAKVPLPSARAAVADLIKEGILRQIDVAGVRMYAADRESGTFRLEKKLYNIRRIHESGLIEHMARQCGDAPIILFGSYERGEDVEDSDIDLYVQTGKKGIEGIARFEKSLGRGIQLFTGESLRSIRNKELANNIINGTKLVGFIEVF
jgi:predicted nucleotidyltransferase